MQSNLFVGPQVEHEVLMLFGPKLDHVPLLGQPPDRGKGFADFRDLECHSERLTGFFVAEGDILLAIVAHVTAVCGFESQIPLASLNCLRIHRKDSLASMTRRQLSQS